MRLRRAGTKTALSGLAVLLGASLTVGALSAPAAAADDRESRVQQRLDRIDEDAMRLGEFMRQLPKGADLHQHVSGAVWAESLLGWAAEQGMCVNSVTTAVYAAPCASGDRSASSTLTSTGAQGDIIANWSMRFFVPSMTESGHDHFFSTFGLFGAVMSTPEYRGRGVAEVLQQADRDGVLRQETMFTPIAAMTSVLSSQLAAQDPSWVTDPAKFGQALAFLQSAGLNEAVAQAQASTDQVIASANSAMGCAADPDALGCSVSYGLMAEVSRNAAPSSVFTQMAVNFALAQADPRWIAVNMVSAEDGLLALEYYPLHMQMVRFLHGTYPRGHVSLHAGELIPGLVPPGELDFHIRQAVEVAGAERIGHGVAIRTERSPSQLMKEMRQRGVSVEVALTSNNQILEVDAATSQFPVYRKAGVTVTLATDDPGVERTDLSEQYELAYDWFDLTYEELKDLSYAGIDEAFVTPSVRTQLRKELDSRFAAFEKRWAA